MRFNFFSKCVVLSKGGLIKARRSIFGSHFFVFHSNNLIFLYVGSIWLRFKLPTFDSRTRPPSSLTNSFIFSSFSPFYPSYSFIILSIFTCYVNTCRLRKAPLHPPPIPTSYNNLPPFLSPPFLSPVCLLS